MDSTLPIFTSTNNVDLPIAGGTSSSESGATFDLALTHEMAQVAQTPVEPQAAPEMAAAETESTNVEIPQSSDDTAQDAELNQTSSQVFNSVDDIADISQDLTADILQESSNSSGSSSIDLKTAKVMTRSQNTPQSSNIDPALKNALTEPQIELPVEEDIAFLQNLSLQSEVASEEPTFSINTDGKQDDLNDDDPDLAPAAMFNTLHAQNEPVTPSTKELSLQSFSQENANILAQASASTGVSGNGESQALGLTAFLAQESNNADDMDINEISSLSVVGNTRTALLQQANLDAATIQKSEIAAPLNSPEFSDEFSNHIVLLAKNGIDSATIKITPPDLGPLHIRLSLKQNDLDIHLQSAFVETRQVLENAMPTLREMLQAQGISLQNATVSDERGGQSDGQQTSGQNVPGIAQEDTAPAEEMDLKAYVLRLIDYYA